jgi:hypothetical protein
MLMEGNHFGNSPEIKKAPASVTEISPIKESRNRSLRTREDLQELVEAPLLKACEELYDKNIRTLSTSANSENITYGDGGHIVIDFDTLSDENKSIGRELGTITFADNMNQLSIGIPMTQTTTVEEIEAIAESIAHEFKKQEMTWAPVWTADQIRAMYAISPEEEFEPQDFADQFYYDEESKLFYLSQEQAQKVRENSAVESL